MIKPIELRVGSWVRHKPVWSYRQDGTEYKEFDFQWSETDWYQEGECCISFEDIEPITISEEYLLKLGFVDNFKQYELTNWGVKVTKDLNSDSTWICYDGFFKFRELCSKQYVHQVQNLYSALSEEEL